MSFPTDDPHFIEASLQCHINFTLFAYGTSEFNEIWKVSHLKKRMLIIYCFHLKSQIRNFVNFLYYRRVHYILPYNPVTQHSTTGQALCRSKRISLNLNIQNISTNKYWQSIVSGKTLNVV